MDANGDHSGEERKHFSIVSLIFTRLVCNPPSLASATLTPKCNHSPCGFNRWAIPSPGQSSAAL